MQKSICNNCHSVKEGKFDIHSIHIKFGELGINRAPVECRICHWLPNGYNSSLAHVPAYENLYIAGSTLMNISIRTPLWGNDCGYCHPSAAGARRLHDVHKPVIKKACSNCHGEGIESRSDLIGMVIHEKAVEKKNVEGKSVIIQMFSDLFDEISRYILKIAS